MWSIKMGEINMNQEPCRRWKIKSWWKSGGGSERGLEGGWMVRGGRVEMEREASVEQGKSESRNERYIASGKQKTIVTLPPITHFNLKQQIFFTQLISTHWSRGLGWSWAFLCCCERGESVHISLPPSFRMSLSVAPVIFLCFGFKLDWISGSLSHYKHGTFDLFFSRQPWSFSNMF